ncbi:MAG: MotA/TolQ/ExbB proton channel family protein [Candidatus Ratteibacteria bacterium]|jgi:biopolymer transport protein TolQ
MQNIWIASWLHCDWVGKTVLVVLVLMSIISWAIIAEKFFLFRRVKKANASFCDLFFSGRVKAILASPWSRILSKIIRKKADTPLNEEVLLNLLHSFAREEITGMERRLSFLLVTSSVAPFLGLLGTVWGLLVAFHDMSIAGSSSITVVASGVAEALITTFVGLLVAIPAAVGYTYFGGHLARMRQEGEDVLERIYLFLK